MNLSDDKKFELLYNHYADTHTGIQALIKSRGRFFVAILTFLAIMSFQIALPTESGNAIAEFARGKLGIKGSLSVSFLSTTIWASLLFIAVRYFQIVVYLERQYKYIHAIEMELSPQYSGTPFTREGSFYEAQYPWFSSLAHRLYNWVFPGALALAATLKIASEVRLSHVSMYALYTDIAIYAVLISAVALYMASVIWKK
jgi:hypothetical protein